MTEDEAHSWFSERDVSRETLGQLEAYLAFLRQEASAQNLVAASTLDCIWSRHIVDSAQLLDHAGDWSDWVDLGSGAGFPGLVAAILGRGRVSLVESRTKRVSFLREAAEIAAVADRVDVIGSRVETMERRRFDVISARAFAPLQKLLEIGFPLSDPATRWILPKGRRAAVELEAVRGSWQGRFELVPSITDPEASIIVATDITPRKRR